MPKGKPVLLKRWMCTLNMEKVSKNEIRLEAAVNAWFQIEVFFCLNILLLHPAALQTFCLQETANERKAGLKGEDVK